MKKIVLALAVIATVACFSSCNKKCECKTYLDGAVVTTNEMEVESGKKCKDYTALLTEDPKNGVECKGTL